MVFVFLDFFGFDCGVLGRRTLGGGAGCGLPVHRGGGQLDGPAHGVSQAGKMSLPGTRSDNKRVAWGPTVRG